MASRDIALTNEILRGVDGTWRRLHGPDTWDANPEVVALTFAIYKINIDAMPKADAA